MKQAQYQALEKIAQNAGQVIFASMVVDLIAEPERTWSQMLIGFLLTAICWLLAYLLSGKIKIVSDKNNQGCDDTSEV